MGNSPSLKDKSGTGSFCMSRHNSYGSYKAIMTSYLGSAMLGVGAGFGALGAVSGCQLPPSLHMPSSTVEGAARPDRTLPLGVT